MTRAEAIALVQRIMDGEYGTDQERVYRPIAL